VLERQRHEPLALPEQDQQEVLAVERVMAQLEEQVLRATERLTGLLGELFNGDHRLSASRNGLPQDQRRRYAAGT
jgi:hypothetical protein